MHAKPGTIDFRIVGEFITLDNLLKVTGVAASGGAAKALAAAGAVKVNGQVELRKTCKIRVGQVVEAEGARICVLAGDDTDPAPGFTTSISPSVR